MDPNEQPPSGFKYTPLGKVNVFEGVVNAIRQPKLPNPARQWKLLSILLLIITIASVSAAVYYSLDIPVSMSGSTYSLELRNLDSTVVTSIDFGTIPIGGQSSEKTFRLYNTGNVACEAYFVTTVPTGWSLSWKAPGSTSWAQYTSGSKEQLSVSLDSGSYVEFTYRLTNDNGVDGSSMTFTYTAEGS